MELVNQVNWDNYFSMEEGPSPAYADIDYLGSDMIDYEGHAEPKLKPFFLQFEEAIHKLDEFEHLKHYEQTEYIFGDKEEIILSNFQPSIIDSDGVLQNSDKQCGEFIDDMNHGSDEDNCEDTRMECFEEVKVNESQATSKDMALEEQTYLRKYVKDHSNCKKKEKALLKYLKDVLEEILGWSQSFHYKVVTEGHKTKKEWEEDGESLIECVELYEKQIKILEKAQEKCQAIQKDLKREKTIETDIIKIEKRLRELSAQHPCIKADKNKLREKIEKVKMEKELVEKEKLELSKRLEITRSEEIDAMMAQDDASSLLEVFKADVVAALKLKKYYRFAPIFECKKDIDKYLTNEEAIKYFEQYDKECSLKYFKYQMKEEELYYWIILLKMALLMIPKTEEELKLLPLQKSTISYMDWLIENKVITIKTKNSLKEYGTRSQLITKFQQLYEKLIVAAQKMVHDKKWNEEKWNSLQKVLRSLDRDSYKSPALPLVPDQSSRSKSHEETPKRHFEDFEYTLDSNEMVCLSPKSKKKVYLKCN